MIGAIIGDIVGSRFQFQSFKEKDFRLFTDLNYYTDDSVMTVAIAKAVLDAIDDLKDDDLFSISCIREMSAYGRKCKNAGYGMSFYNWIMGDHTPYGSFGNGAAMRISPIGWIAESIDEVKRLSRLATEVSHNHEEGIKGAEAVAMSIFLSRKGYDKEQIRKYISENYYERIGKQNFFEHARNYGDISLMDDQDGFSYYVSCQGSVPEAIMAFLESTDFEDAIRNAILLGGDSDTLAAMTGSIAEAYYGVKDEMREKAYSYLNDDLRDMVKRFRKEVMKIEE